MLINFFFSLREAKIPVTIREFIDLLAILDKKIVFASVNDFYNVAKLSLIKDEKYFDKFDLVFSAYFQEIDSVDLDLTKLNIPKEWLLKKLARYFSEEEMNKIKSQGDLEELIRKFKDRLKEQKERHQGGNKWIGTGGTSPFGAHGYNPNGFRIDQGYSAHRRAIKVWEERKFYNLDEDNVLNHRNMQITLKRLRNFARSNNKQEFDLDATILSTAKNAGFLDIKSKFSRDNLVNVILFFDVGGSMDDYIEITKQLFQAAKSEFKLMQYFYFHNCIYDYVWTDNNRRKSDIIPINSILNKYSSNYKIIFVSDASMSPYEIMYPGGSIEYFNKEAGIVWIKRILNHFDKCIWINPTQKEYWNYTESILIIKQIINNRMYPLTIDGLNQAMKKLQ